MVEIHPNILSSVLQIIDTGAARGAFRGEELLAVGSAREAIAQTIKNAEAAAAAPSGETVEEPEAATED